MTKNRIEGPEALQNLTRETLGDRWLIMTLAEAQVEDHSVVVAGREWASTKSPSDFIMFLLDIFSMTTDNLKNKSENGHCKLLVGARTLSLLQEEWLRSISRVLGVVFMSTLKAESMELHLRIREKCQQKHGCDGGTSPCPLRIDHMKWRPKEDEGDEQQG